MYSVSNAFKEQMKSPIQEHKITGTIGSVSFDEANIVEGSFSISNQSTDTNDVVLGSCYVGQLTAEFVGINIAYGKWINKTITLSFGLKVGEYYEYVPLGVYKVKEAKHTDHGVQVTAYDNMIKFDKKFRKSHFMNLSGMTNIIDQLCLDAGVVCGMSHAQIEDLPNGDRTGINIYGSTGKKAEFANDITTLRDLLFWVAQTLGCFATINRAGQLEFRQYTQDVVDNISNVHRIEGATFADYITHYVGIYVENLDDNTEDYYGYDTTALQQELTETMAEITEDQEDITDLELDRADWVQKLANHECTQQEYDAAIAEINAQEKELTKEINQLSKRAEWLSNAIAQSADDGSDMVLGANPLTMAKNLTTRDQQRREILGALSNISYTPFQASVLCGCIYDLGDVIQWSGGLYNSDTDSFGCVMSYTYTHNGGTELEGFGVDPSVVVVRNKTQKSTDRATRNATTALNENDLVFGIDPDKNNAVVATNKKAYTQSLTTRVIYIWAYNVAWPPAAAIYKVTITSDSGNFAIVDTTATSGQYPCDVNGIIRYDSPAWLVWELPEGSQEPNITVRSERVWDNGYHPEYTLGEWWANGYNHCVYTENGVSWYANGGFGGSIQHGIAYEYGEMPDENFESEAAMHSAIFTGKVHPAGVSPYDQDMLATESTAMQAAANAEYLADKIAGNNPSRKSETFYGSVNVMSEKTIERLSQAFYSMGENVGSITNNVDDVKVDNVSVVTNKVANITMPVTDVQVNGSSVLSDKVANIVLPVIDVKSDGTSVITNKIAIINTMTGATAGAAGTKGLVPSPASGDNEKYLRGDGTWGTGGNVNLFGTSAIPSNSLGKDGDRYYVLTRADEKYKYLKWEVYRTRNATSGRFGCGEIDFVDEDSNKFSWSGTTVACNKPCDPTWCPANTLIDGNYDKGPVIYSSPTVNDPHVFTLTLGDEIDFGAHEYTFRVYLGWNTGLVNSNHDPVAFNLYGSKDGNVWSLLDSVDNSSLVFPYTSQIGSVEHYQLTGTVFIKLDGQWQLDVDGEKSVVANPQETATENLTKVGIDGTVYAVTDSDAVHSADIGVAGGVAELDSNGRVPSSQLPSYVDDVVEYASRSAFPATGESGKIYVALDTNLAYRWGGTEYVEISPSLALGETSSTAYRGDRGKAAYDHTQLFPIVDGAVCIVFEE